MKKRLDRKFFERKTLLVARELLGKFLVRKIGDTEIAVQITETEAYHGPDDLASHASKGVTPRTKVMFGPAGYSYVYLIYGMYHCLNIVTEKDGYPSAVLVRAVKILNPKHEILNKFKIKTKVQKSLGFRYSDLVLSIDGPGKLCRELKIDKSLNMMDMIGSQELWVEDRGTAVSRSAIKTTPRIGVAYAGEYKDKPWRFVLESNK
jgi:DNA-3-methyladenine glycosylase